MRFLPRLPISPALALLTVMAVTACGSRTPSTPSTPSQPGAQAQSVQQPQVDFETQLANAEYPHPDTLSGVARLEGGFFEEQATPGSETKLRISIGQERRFGDLNGDGAEDAVVVLISEPGGTGIFAYLAAVLNDHGRARPTAPVLLEEVLGIKDLAIHGREVWATVLTNAAEDQAETGGASREITRKFVVLGDRLVEVSEP